MRIYLFAIAFILTGIPFVNASAYYGDGCEQYGFMAYESLGYCKCMSGYAFATDIFGDKTCKSLDTICSDKLGFSARYNSLYDTCECGYGDVIDGGRCTDGDYVCHRKHGYNSSYDSLSERCECDSGYTFDDSYQCVEKQNNVYFTLLDIETDENLAIIRSDYDSTKYLIKYGYGCYDFSFRRYLRDQIVVNLGTDFYLDTWDKIVLQDDDEVCDITSEERTYYSTFDEMYEDLEEEEDYGYTYTYTYPTLPTPNPAPAPVIIPTPTPPVNQDFIVLPSKIQPFDEMATVEAAANFRRCPSTQCSIISSFRERSEVKIIGKYVDEEWYQVQATTGTGWIHSSVLNMTKETSSGTSTMEMVGEKEDDFISRFWRGFLGWFK